MIASSHNKQKQQTIDNEISFSGIGLHSGNESKVIIKPSEKNNGIKFIRTDIQKNNVIKALWFNVTSTVLSTTISNRENVSVSTIEHLMSALSGMHIDNADIFINGQEVPIMDGSSRPFVDLLEQSGITIQNDYRKIIKVNKEVKVSKDDCAIALTENTKAQIM